MSTGSSGSDRPPRPNLPPLTPTVNNSTASPTTTMSAPATTPSRRRLRKDPSDVFIVDETELVQLGGAAAGATSNTSNIQAGRPPLPSPTNRSSATSNNGAGAWTFPNPGSSHYSIDPSKLFTVDSEINHDILVMINNYLTKCGLNATSTTLRNEASLHAKQSKQSQRLVREAVLEGDWESLREISKTGPPPRLRRAFLYLVNRQEFLELVNKQESQQAFSQLLRRLKPLEALAKTAGDDFRDLAYLATCRSVTDAPAFRNWDGVTMSRRKLARDLCGMVTRNDLFKQSGDDCGEDNDDAEGGGGSGAHGVSLTVAGGGGGDEEQGDGGSLSGFLRGHGSASFGLGGAGESLMTDSDMEMDSVADEGDQQSNSKPGRLITLLQQAYAYQVEKKTQTYYQDRPDLVPAAPRVTSLLVDFTAPVLPDAKKVHVLSGHEQSVKCMEFLNGDRRLVASGSSDCDVCLWDFDNLLTSSSTTPPMSKTFLKGHSGRIWDLASSKDGTLLTSVSADSSLRVWDTTKIRLDESTYCLSQLVDTQHSGDAYSVSFHPESRRHVVTAGHDQTVRLIDIEQGKVVKVFRGHTGSVVHAIFNPVGNLIVTGSKDSTVKFFDVVSGVCVKTIPQLLGAVTSVQLNRSGDKLLTGTKDSSNRLWDIRTSQVLSRFKGHVNSSKNFIRAQFGASDQIVLGGSEDGAVYVWDADTGRVLDKLTGHSGSVFRASWSHQWGVLGSCSEDGTVRLWEAKASSAVRGL